VGELLKSQVRLIAKKIKLPVAEKKDSTGICFIGERNFSKFLSNYLSIKPGPICRLDGTFLKFHNGIHNYTIGQRKGLGLGGTKESVLPWCVVKKDQITNTLYVEHDNHPYLFSNNAILRNVIIRDSKCNNITCKFRYRGSEHTCSYIWLNYNDIHIFYTTAKAVTPGQFCAIYDGTLCLGSGIIDKVFFDKEERL